MRYYAVTIIDPDTGEPIRGADMKPFGPYSSHVMGKNNPGALDIEFDIPATTFDQPAGVFFFRIWGVGLAVMGQASNFNGANIVIEGGMEKGLPLADPTQKGVLVRGVVLQAYGNWQGVNQTLDFQVAGGYFGSATAPGNIIFEWGEGQSLTDAAVLSLRNAFSDAEIITASTRDGLVLPYDPQAGTYQSVAQFAQYLYVTSLAIVNEPGYLGIKIYATENGFRLFDGPSDDPALGVTEIRFNDLIGQPTWLDLQTISFKTVMRGDLEVGGLIKMPQGPTITTAQSYSQYRNRATFTGTFIVLSVRHIGHYKQRAADSWITVFEAVAV